MAFCGASTVVHTWSFLCNIVLCKLFDWCILTREIRTRSNNQVLSILRGFGKIVCQLFLQVSKKLEKNEKLDFFNFKGFNFTNGAVKCSFAQQRDQGFVDRAKSWTNDV